MNADVESLKQRWTPKQGKVVNADRQLTMVRFSPCGKVLAGAGYDAKVRRWQVEADSLTELPALEGHNGWVSSLAFAGERLLSADTWGKLVCSTYAGTHAKPVWSADDAHDGWVRSLAVSPDGKTLASCGRDGKILLWSVADGKTRRELASTADDIYSVAFHPDGKSLVSGDLFGVIKHWDLASGKVVRTLDAKVLHVYSRLQDVGGVRCFSFDREGKTLLAAGGQPKNGASVQATPMVIRFDWSSGKATSTEVLGTVNDGFVFDLYEHPAGFLMVVTSGQPGNGKLLLHCIGEKEPFFSSNKMANCHSLAIHPDGTRFVVASTNARSNGNGRRLGMDMEYPGNYSPLNLWTY